MVDQLEETYVSFQEQEEEEELASLGYWTETVLKEKEEVVQNEDQREQLFLSW